MGVYRLLFRLLLRRLDPETAHALALRALAIGSRVPAAISLAARPPAAEALSVRALGLRFANPLGVAAGLDKNAVAVPALHALGFGHVEVGTVTPQPQPGNASPRMFRLLPDRAL